MTPVYLADFWMADSPAERAWSDAFQLCSCRPPLLSLRVYLGHLCCEKCRKLVRPGQRRPGRLT